ncbi:hypothetical protein Landi51_13599 [Colletotrichum acutatum]
MFDTASPPLICWKGGTKKQVSQERILRGRRKGGAIAAEAAAAAAAAAFVPFSDDVRRLAAAADVTERSTRREDDNVLRGVQAKEAEGTVIRASHVATASVVFLTPYASTAWATRAGGRGPLLSTLPGVSSPLIQTSQSIRPLGSPSIAGWAVSGLSTSQPSPSSELATFQSTIGVQRPDAELLNNDAECLPPSVSWLPLANPDRSILDVDIFQASQQVLSHRLAVPKLIFENFETAHDDDNTPQHGQSSGPWSHPAESRVQFPERPASGIDEQIALLPVDQNPLNKKLLRLYIAVLSRFKASINGDPSPNNPFIRHYSPFCLQDPLVMQIILYTSACFLHETGDVRTDVLRICKGQAIAMLNENLTMDSSKSRASNTPALTSTDANRSSTSVFQKPGDAAIAGVIQLTVAEWYWGESDQDLRYHLMGLRDMIRVRGGFNQLGMDGLLAKNAIVHDVSISLAHENSPLLLTLSSSDDDREGGGSGCKGSTGSATAGGAANSARRALATPYAFVDPIKDVPLRMANLSPMVTHLPCSGTLPSFSDCATSLRIHPATASILDNVKYLLSVVDAIYDESATLATTNPASLKARAMGKYILSSDPPTRTNSPPNSNYPAAFDRESIRSGKSGLYVPGYPNDSVTLHAGRHDPDAAERDMHGIRISADLDDDMARTPVDMERNGGHISLDYSGYRAGMPPDAACALCEKHVDDQHPHARSGKLGNGYGCRVDRHAAAALARGPRHGRAGGEGGVEEERDGAASSKRRTALRARRAVSGCVAKKHTTIAEETPPLWWRDSIPAKSWILLDTSVHGHILQVTKPDNEGKYFPPSWRCEEQAHWQKQITAFCVENDVPRA